MPEPMAKIIYDKQAHDVLASNTGRRPMRSDKRPHKGAKINCMTE